MKILIIDDDGQELMHLAESSGDVSVESLRVCWNDDFQTHSSAYAAVQDILACKPDVIFLDHNLGYKTPPFGQRLEHGGDVARILRDQGFTGRLIGTSSEKQLYCDGKSGKVQRVELSKLLAHVGDAVEITS